MYFIFILDYGNDVRQKANKRFSYLSSKQVIKQWRQLTTSTTHLVQELLLLTNAQCSGGSRSSAKKTRALKMRRAVASHRGLTTIS